MQQHEGILHLCLSRPLALHHPAIRGTGE